MKIVIGTLFSIVAFAVGCRKDIERPRVLNLDATISFSKNIQPIFNNNCAKSGCHVEWGQAPNLSPGVAYDQLLELGYVDPSNPEGSLLYQRVSATVKPMPPTGNLSSLQINSIYAWIKQDARNN
jgi:hypothetical protein